MKTCWISDISFAFMRSEADGKFPAETGGVLVGYQTRVDAVVMEIVGPGPQAIHERMTFIPDHEYQEAEIARVYAASKRQWTYLGDWHTHPLATTPRLSPRDIETLNKISRYEQARLPKPLMGIMSGGPGSWNLRVWQFSRRSFFSPRIARLDLSTWMQKTQKT